MIGTPSAGSISGAGTQPVDGADPSPVQKMGAVPAIRDGATLGHRLSRWKRRTDRGKKIAMSSTGQATAMGVACSVSQEPPPQLGLPKRCRVAATVEDSGFHSAIVPSQPGMVPGATKVLDRKVTGQTRICTARTLSGPLI